VKRATKNLRRLGCAGLLMLWFILLVVLPCSAISLASGSEIQLTHSSVPDDYTLRVWLIQQTHLRGLGVSTGYAVNPTDQTVCTITDTHFILWEGSSEGGQSCACYDRQPDGTYSPRSLGAEACTFAGK
jgi:hypothetical protein